MNASPPKGRSILVVEDEIAMRKLVADLLNELGYQVISAASGKEALSLFEANPAAVHMLLADIMLPGEMDGLAVVKAARRLRPNLPVCYMTGNVGAIAMLEKCEEEGEWLHKPFRMERLASVVQTALGQAAH